MNKDHASFVVLVAMALLVSSVIFITNYEEILPASKPAEFELGFPEFESKGSNNETTVSIDTESPEYPEDEKIEIDYESIYIQNSRYLNLSHDFGLFETKLMRIGWYENPEEGIHEPVFRADIWVKNTGNAPEEFKETNAFIQKTSDGTYNITESHFNGENIDSGEEREGYLLFETVPSNISGDVRFSIGTSRGYSALFGIQLHSPHVYLITL